MSFFVFNHDLAQQIVERTMAIIDCNINIMNEKGEIIASGDTSRIGEIHDGALLALSQNRVVPIHEQKVYDMMGVKPGINFPLRLNDKIVGVIGLTGDPAQLNEFGKLVCMTAEMMLEQAQLFGIIAQNERLKEELILDLIHSDEISPSQQEWALRLGVDLNMPRVVCIIEIDEHNLSVEEVRQELQNMQILLKNPERDNLVAILSLTELVILKPALTRGRWDVADHMERIKVLLSRMDEASKLHVRIALGNYFPDSKNNISLSYHTAKTTLSIGKTRFSKQRVFNYQDLMLPVLLNQLKDGWQKEELSRIFHQLARADKNGLLRKTLTAWFEHNMQTGATAQALHIHRNTLEYRLNKIAELTRLDLLRTDDRFLLYIAIHMTA